MMCGINGKEDTVQGITTWEDGKRRLVLAGVEEDTGGVILSVSLEKIDDQAQGGSQDGFKEFFADFKAAMESNDQKKLYSMFKVPFKDSYFTITKNKPDYSFNNFNQFQKKYSQIFADKNRKEILESQPAFNKATNGYDFPLDLIPVRVERQKGRWIIVERECPC